MAMVIRLQTHALTLTEQEEQRIRRQLAHLEQRLGRYPSPITTLVISAHEAERRITADLRVQLGHLGEHLVAHEDGETAANAARLAVEEVERQIERLHATLAGEATYGVPSRREPPHVPEA